MADCALCGHPREDHRTRCRRVIGAYINRFGVRCTFTCDCPGFEPPEDEENN